MTTPPPVVEMRGISIEFPGVKALQGVDFTLRAGEIHAVMGENGAGKSTLIKALTGVYAIDSGRIVIDGVERMFAGPAAAQAAGISTVYQEVNLCGNLTVAENIMLGREPRRGGAIDWRATRSAAATHLGALILDEPTSSLDAGEVQQLFTVMRGLRDDGVAILFVSHFLEQVYEVSDRITVLRNGQLLGEYATSELPRLALVSKMIGKSLAVLEELEEAPKRSVAALDSTVPYLQAIGLGRRGAVEAFDLDLYAGEVVGIAGLLGSGRTELARLLSGADRADVGQVRMGDMLVHLRTPRAALARKIAYSSEDRKSEGVVGDLTVRENIMLGLQAERGWTRRIPAKRADEIVGQYVAALDIRPANPDMPARNLSGGNQQKVLLARWLATAPKLLVLDEPTRGIDVGTKAEIQRLVAELAQKGMSVVFISSELEEVLRVSHRVAVMRDHRKIAEIVNDDDVGIDDIVELIASGGRDS